MEIILVAIVCFLLGGGIGEGMEQKNIEISVPAIERSVEVSRVEVSNIDGFDLEESL